tara:strand:- start:1349 stop:1915 length:567 start_codon:yes stop_codon:yes gene_type:complete
MASIIKANQLQDFGGNSILTSDGAGNVTVNAAAMKMTPAFEAHLSADQSVSDAVLTKAEVDIEVFDTDNCYDNTTNYRFTPNVAGKYFVYAKVCLSGSADASVRDIQTRIYKNGTSYANTDFRYDNNDIARGSPVTIAIIEMNGTTDYLEMFGYINTISGSPSFLSDVAGTVSQQKATSFGAYKMIGA